MRSKSQRIPYVPIRAKIRHASEPNPRGIIHTYVTLSGSDGYGAIPVSELDDVLDQLIRVRGILTV